jgi:hypothetical protein
MHSLDVCFSLFSRFRKVDVTLNAIPRHQDGQSVPTGAKDVPFFVDDLVGEENVAVSAAR